MLERDLHRADALLMEARALARRVGVEAASMPDASGVLSMHRGELNAAAADFEKARFLARRDGDRIGEFLAMEHLAELEFSRKRHAEAEAIAGDMLRLAGRLAPGSEAPFAEALLALCRIKRGMADAEADLDRALAALRLADAKRRLLLCLRWAAEIDAVAGRCDRAMARGAESLALAMALDRKSDIALARAAIERAGSGETQRDAAA
jgi:tetratricopeptide (TPR) repeat protein